MDDPLGMPDTRPLCHCGFRMLHILNSDNYWFCKMCDQPFGICPKTRRSGC